MPLDPLQVECPHCKAPAGQKCKNYLGKGTAPHRDRKKAADPSVEYRRQAELKTERERAKVLKETPLFAEEALAEVRTPEQNYDRTRLMRAAGAGASDPNLGFTERWHVRLLTELARRVMPPDLFALAVEKFSGRWVGYPVLKWRALLTTTERFVLRLERHVHFGPFLVTLTPGQAPPWYSYERVEVVEAEHWPPEGWRPPYTAAQLDAVLRPPPSEDPDDGGLAALVDRVLAHSTKDTPKG